jgi:glutathione synthase/RimK-type ligase-like ATP-grasp enzyme
MTKPTILIVSCEDDAHIPFVTRYLPEDSFVVVDPAQFAVGKTLSYQLVRDAVEATYNGKSLRRIRSVWYRKPAETEKADLPVAPEFYDYVSSGLHHHFVGLFTQFPEAFWISDFYALQKSANKTAQLRLARELGFMVPETIVTADPAVAKEFLQEHDECIIKPVSRFGITLQRNGKGEKTIFYATKVHQGQDIDLTNLHLAPSYFQEAIDPVADIRVNVVGDKIFATTITNPGLDPTYTTRDWRLGHTTNTIQFTPHDLPVEVAHKCLAFMEHYGLQFSAFDLILDKKGEYWFIECNPNGQWAFVEDETEQPIGRAIADLLMRHAMV